MMQFTPFRIVLIVLMIVILIGIILLAVGANKSLPSNSDSKYDAEKKTKNNLILAGSLMLVFGVLGLLGAYFYNRKKPASVDSTKKYAQAIIDDIKDGKFGEESRHTCDLMIDSMRNPGVVTDYNIMKLANAKDPYMTDNFCKTTAANALQLKALPKAPGAPK